MPEGGEGVLRSGRRRTAAEHSPPFGLFRIAKDLRTVRYPLMLQACFISASMDCRLPKFSLDIRLCWLQAVNSTLMSR